MLVEAFKLMVEAYPIRAWVLACSLSYMFVAIVCSIKGLPAYRTADGLAVASVDMLNHEACRSEVVAEQAAREVGWETLVEVARQIVASCLLLAAVVAIIFGTW